MRPVILATTAFLTLTIAGSALAHSPWSAPYPVAAHYRPLPPPPRPWYAHDRPHCPPPVAWRAPPRWVPPVSTNCWTARGVARLTYPQPVGSACGAVTAWGAVDRGIVR